MRDKSHPFKYTEKGYMAGFLFLAQQLKTYPREGLFHPAHDLFSCSRMKEALLLSPSHVSPPFAQNLGNWRRGQKWMVILAPRHSRQATRKRFAGLCQKPTHESCRCFGFLGRLKLCMLFPLTLLLCCCKYMIQAAQSPCQALYWQNPMCSAACWVLKASALWVEINNL